MLTRKENGAKMFYFNYCLQKRFTKQSDDWASLLSGATRPPQNLLATKNFEDQVNT